MAYTFTTGAKWALKAITGTSLISDIDSWASDFRDQIEAIIATADTGTLASRPVSTGGSPGKFGRFYRVTDSTPVAGRLDFDHGTGWDEDVFGVETSTALAHPHVQVFKSTTAFSWINGFVAFTWDGTNFEQNGNLWDVSNPTRLLIPRTGLYAINPGIDYGNVTPNFAYRVNGSTVVPLTQNKTNGVATLPMGRFAVGDYIEIGSKYTGSGSGSLLSAPIATLVHLSD